MRCCAHILNLIVRDGLDIIHEGIEKIRDSVVYWTATPKRVEKSEDVARQLNIAYSKKSSLDCKTRWNSTYVMLSTALPYKNSRLSEEASHFNDSFNTQMEVTHADEDADVDPLMNLDLFLSNTTTVDHGSSFKTHDACVTLFEEDKDVDED
ncbi:hypothetical protein EZV62_023929 [Acer yangbiense]|uniref:hAT-like transposase RNase-H fold domain-containing protein n=1 Tax=Acer yangbiense TaxID=1000413 RepID=A0A5C7H3V5_9ROSI|nr:hypothetical protein EZV62_023929 [Acer yangbiense]